MVQKIVDKWKTDSKMVGISPNISEMIKLDEKSSKILTEKNALYGHDVSLKLEVLLPASPVTSSVASSQSSLFHTMLCLSGRRWDEDRPPVSAPAWSRFPLRSA